MLSLSTNQSASQFRTETATNAELALAGVGMSTPYPPARAGYAPLDPQPLH